MAVFPGPHPWCVFCEQYKFNSHYEIHFNIILPHMFKFSKWPLSFSASRSKLRTLCTFVLPRVIRAPPTSSPRIHIPITTAICKLKSQEKSAKGETCGAFALLLFFDLENANKIKKSLQMNLCLSTFYATHTIILLRTLATDLKSIIIDILEMSRYCKRRDLQSMLLDCYV